MKTRLIPLTLVVVSFLLLFDCADPGTEARKSDNANLSALTVSEGTLTPAFESGITSYSVSVANSVSSIIVTGTASDSNATLSANNGVSLPLSPGSNPISIRVTAQDEIATMNYAVTVTRAAPEDPEPDAIYVIGYIMNTHDPDECSAIFQLTNDGIIITNASVLINGFPCVYDSIDQMYSASITPIGAGDSVTLRITGENIDISESLIMTETPIITAPTSAGSPYDASEIISAAWNDFSTDPMEVVISVDNTYTAAPQQYCNFESGTANAHSIPANTLKHDQSGIRVNVRSDNSKELTGASFESGSSFMVGNMSSSEPFSTAPGTLARRILVKTYAGHFYKGAGGIPSSSDWFTFTRLSENGVAVSDATVQLNGVTCPFNTSGNAYFADITPILVNADVRLTITGTNLNITETLTMPEAPVITAPTTAGGPYDASEPLIIEWEDFENTPSNCRIQLNHSLFSLDVLVDPQTVHSFSLPENVFSPAETGIEISVSSFERADFIGTDYEDGSFFELWNLTLTEPFDMAP